MESKQLHSIIGIWTNACRFLLAAVFIFSGFVKAVDPLGTQYKIQDYLEVFGWAASVPAFLPFLASVLQAMVEFCLGVYLLFGIRRRMTTLFVVLIMGVMTPLTLWLALSNPISDCGCFGDAVTLTNWETFGKNVLLLIAAVSVFKWGNRITPLVTKRFDWLVAMYTFLYISGMTLYCYRELPVFDFRPYHIGADIRKGMEIPEGEKPTVYETRFILQKDGVEKEFTLENYPDSTWTFVDSKTMVKEQGYEPPVHDFSIIRQEDGEDITDEVLDDDYDDDDDDYEDEYRRRREEKKSRNKKKHKAPNSALTILSLVAGAVILVIAISLSARRQVSSVVKHRQITSRNRIQIQQVQMKMEWLQYRIW